MNQIYILPTARSLDVEVRALDVYPMPDVLLTRLLTYRYCFVISAGSQCESYSGATAGDRQTTGSTQVRSDGNILTKSQLLQSI